MDSVLTIYRDWRDYKISGDRTVLNKAYQTAFAALRNNKSDLHMYFCCILLGIEKGDFDKATDLLDGLTAYKNYFKNNEPRHYAYYLYLNSLAELRCNKYRNGKKYLRLLEEYSVGRDGNVYDLLLASLKLASHEYEAAFVFLQNAYLRGNRMLFMFMCLHDYYANELNLKAKTNMIFVPYLKWGISHGLPMEPLLEEYKEAVIKAMAEDSGLSELLLERYPMDWILNEICNGLIKRKDFSERAFIVYNEAIAKQSFTKEINDSFVKSSYKMGFEDVSRYSILQFLEKPLDTEMKPFIYHLVLTNKKHKDLIENLGDQIFQFAFYALENNLRGRYYNSIYKYFLDCTEEQDIPKELVSKAEIFLISELFLYDVKVHDKNCKFLWVQEKEKKGMKVYPVVNGQVNIKVLNEKFAYYCLDEGRKKLFDSKITLKKRIENADFKLYQNFFRKKLLSTELLIELSKYYLALEKPDSEAIEVLERTLKESGLSYQFLMSVSATLGNIYYLHGEYEKAFSYYKDLNENSLQDKQVEQMLLVFATVADQERVVNLIIKKASSLPEKTLFHVISQLKDENDLKRIVSTCYDLILKSWYDKTLLHTVLNHYTASQAEWQALSSFLSHMLIETKDLDEKILKNAVYMNQYDIGSQKIFAKLYQLEPNSEAVENFAYYTAYEIIVHSTKLEHETIEVLEDMALKTGEHLLFYALSHLYLESNITTLHSDNILRQAIHFLEQDHFILPVFKLIKDKSLMTAYIEKNQPFIFTTSPNKNVYLYYKVEGQSQYKSKKMKYQQFGMYMTTLTQFYNDKIIYYFSEQLPTGSIDSKEHSVDNTRINLQEGSEDPYYVINNALIYEQMFRYDTVEQIITERLKDAVDIKGKILEF